MCLAVMTCLAVACLAVPGVDVFSSGGSHGVIRVTRVLALFLINQPAGKQRPAKKRDMEICQELASIVGIESSWRYGQGGMESSGEGRLRRGGGGGGAMVCVW